jgi:chitinase
LLLQQVRDSLDAVGKPDGHKLLLSAALSIAPSNASNIEVEAVASVLDFLNLMTYDCFGVWDPVTNHNSPLYAPAAGDSTLNVDAAFRLYHDRFGVPADRINLGVPFYGHAFAGSAELHGRHAGADTTICFEPGNITYVEIVKRSAEFERRWDDRAKVPYLVSKLRNLFVSFDDEASVALKADYVVKHGARGLIVWEVTDDFFDDGRTPLLDAIHRTFQGKP